MTDAEWLDCNDPASMLDSLRDKASERQLRLYAAACCRQVWSLLCDERSRAAVEAAERYADGLLSAGALETAFLAACDASRSVPRSQDRWPETVLKLRRRRNPDQLFFAAAIAGFAAGSRAGELSVHVRAEKNCQEASMPDRPSRVRLVRCIFGNPLRPVTLKPAWLAWNDGTIPKLAQAIYEERGFERLPILADALEEAGCADAVILDHCRGPGPHVRGCWAVDLLLGKE